VSRARWLRTSRVSSGGTSVDADIFWPHRPAAAEEACRMHAKLADYSWPLRHVCWQRTHATLLTSTSSGFSGPPVAEDPCSGHQRDSGRTRAETAHSAAALPSTKVKTTIRTSWLASGLRRWVAGAAGPEAWRSRSHRSLGGPGFESTTVVLGPGGMLCCGGTREGSVPPHQRTPSGVRWWLQAR